MKKSLFYRLASTGTALLLSASLTFPVSAAAFDGHLDSVTESGITGWAWDKDSPDSALTVEILLSKGNGPGTTSVLSVTADRKRADLKEALGSASHAFTYPIDWSAYKEKQLLVSAAIIDGENRIPLEGAYLYHIEEKTFVEATADYFALRDGVAQEAQPQESFPDETDVDGIDIGPGFAGSEKIASAQGSASDNADEDNVSNQPEIGSQEGPAEESTEASSEIETGVQGAYLGKYTVTGYCSCKICSNGWGLTYSGTVPKANHTISADLKLHPIGTKLMINGIVYTVEDMGGGVNNKHIDVYFDTHAEASAFGMKTMDVYAVE